MSTSKPSVRVCNVSFLNSAPYRALKDLNQVEYREATPAECARQLLEREVDIALIPIAEAIQLGDFETLPWGIAAKGEVESVILFSDCPLADLQQIRVDGASYTSVALLRILLKNSAHEATIIDPAGNCSFEPPLYRTSIPDGITPELRDREGLLAIGDACLRLQQKFQYSYDLSKLWLSLTGKPFLFAAWTYRKGEISEQQLKEITSLCVFGTSQKLTFAREYAEEKGLDKLKAEHYVTSRIVYPLDSEIFAGAQEFLKRGAEAGVFPAAAQDSPLWQRQSYRSTTETTAAGSDRKLQKQTDRKRVEALLESSSLGGRLSVADGLLLAEHASLFELGIAADRVREAKHHGEGVSYIIDRNINYTNVCNVYCRFCAFYRAPEIAGRQSAKSKGGYVLTKEELGEKIAETVAAGGVQILLQGGLNPELGIEYYEDLFRWIKQNYRVNLHALSADEILHIASVSNLTLDEVFDRLIAAGLGSLPGAGAEILIDSVRHRIARLKSPAEEWLNVHRTAHRKGLISTCTMMFGVQESWEDRLLHLLKLRQLQDETGGFTAFITWPFQEENTKLERGDTSAEEYLRVQSLCRLFLDNIPGVQSSWVTMGPSLGQIALSFGANDFGSVMFEENVVSAAGTTYCMNAPLIERHIREAGFNPWQRNVHYESVAS